MTSPSAAVDAPILDEKAAAEAGGGGRRDDERFDWLSAMPFLLVHLSPLLIVLTGVTWRAVALLLLTFWGRQFCITAGYHRYFSHRTYRMARVPQFLMAFGGTMAVQKGPLWWAGHHRSHHRFADTAADVHSPIRGFWWSHVGWILCDRFGTTDVERIPDFAAYPELRFLDRHDWIGPWTLAVACLLVGGWSGLVVGFFVSTVLLWHATFVINSVAHVIGRRPFATDDTSRNSAGLAVLTMGEGWHNNHHHWPASARTGFRWWQWDPTYYGLKVLSWLHLVHDLRVVPRWALERNLTREGSFDLGIFRANWARAAKTMEAASANVGERVHDRATQVSDAVTSARESIDGTRASLSATLEHQKEGLERTMQATLQSAEQLARVRRDLERRRVTERA